jgi:hypothetical protein
MILPADTSGSKNSIQAIGSTISYAKRYTVTMLLNIVTVGQDDNAVAACQITKDQEEQIITMVEACELTESEKVKFSEYIGVPTISEIQAARYNDVMEVLRKKISLKHKKRTK